jgi:hypothetical protein
MPDASALLLSRIDSSLRELGRVETPLDKLALEFDKELRERIVGRFRRELESKRKQLGQLRTDVLADGEELSDCWARFTPIERELPSVFGECLAFLEGALARQHKLDNGLCAIADALLEELSRRSGVEWSRFTILADGEYYTQLSDMIRIRFSEASLWNLPVASHELGHYVAPRLAPASGLTFEKLQKRERLNDARRAPLLHEVFADVFGTYTLGPAYAFACLLRFDPSIAYADDRSHPAAAKRLRVITRTFEQLDKLEQGVFAKVREDIDVAWRLTLVAAGQPERLEDRAPADGELKVDVVDAWAVELFELVDASVNPDARFGSDRWLRSQQISSALREIRRTAQDRLPDLVDDDGITEVINGAWHARWTEWDGAASFGAAAFDLSNEIRAKREKRR